MTILRSLGLSGLALALTACGQNTPADPAATVAPSEASGEVPSTRPQTPTLPGRGPTSFVGRWASNVAWCANPQGDGHPIEITPTTFKGYENSCEIAALQEVADGYVATLACVGEGTATTERVHFNVSNDVLRMTWLDRDDEPFEYNKCTTLTDTATRPPTAP